MSDGSVRTPDFPVKTGLAANDSLVANWTDPNTSVTNTVLVTASALLNNTAVSSIRFSSSTPANSTANGVTGTIQWDSGFVYVCVSNNTWKRAALASF